MRHHRGIVQLLAARNSDCQSVSTGHKIIRIMTTTSSYWPPVYVLTTRDRPVLLWIQSTVCHGLEWIITSKEHSTNTEMTIRCESQLTYQAKLSIKLLLLNANHTTNAVQYKALQKYHNAQTVQQYARAVERHHICRQHQEHQSDVGWSSSWSKRTSCLPLAERVQWKATISQSSWQTLPHCRTIQCKLTICLTNGWRV